MEFNNNKSDNSSRTSQKQLPWKITCIVCITIFIALIAFFVFCLSLTAKKYSNLKLEGLTDEEVFRTLSNIWYSVFKYIPGKEEGTHCVGFSTTSIILLSIAVADMVLGIFSIIFICLSRQPKHNKKLKKE